MHRGKGEGSPGVGWDQLGGKYPLILGRFARGWWWCRMKLGGVVVVQIQVVWCQIFLGFFFSFYFEFKNLTFPGFKMPSERFLFKNLKTGLTFCHM